MMRLIQCCRYLLNAVGLLCIATNTFSDSWSLTSPAWAICLCFVWLSFQFVWRCTQAADFQPLRQFWCVVCLYTILLCVQVAVAVFETRGLVTDQHALAEGLRTLKFFKTKDTPGLRLLDADGLLPFQGIAVTAWCTSLLGACRMNGSMGVARNLNFEKHWKNSQFRIDELVPAHNSRKKHLLQQCTQQHLHRCFSDGYKNPTTLSKSLHGPEIVRAFAEEIAPLQYDYATSLLHLQMTIDDVIGDTQSHYEDLRRAYGSSLQDPPRFFDATRRIVVFWGRDTITDRRHRFVKGTWFIYHILRRLFFPNSTPEEVLIVHVDELSNWFSKTDTVLRQAQTAKQTASVAVLLAIERTHLAMMHKWGISETDWPVFLLDNARDAANTRRWYDSLQRVIQIEIINQYRIQEKVRAAWRRGGLIEGGRG